MKKITAILMVVFVMTALVLPVLADGSPERGILVVASQDELPEASAESPDFVFVMDESVVYVKYVDPVTGEVKYVPETALDDFGYVVTPEQTWFMGTEDEGLTFSSTADFAKFVDVYVDGVLVADDCYAASEGSTVIALTPAYLESLGVGDYTITVLSNDGSGSCPFHIKAAQAPSQDTETGTQQGADTQDNQGGKSSQTGDTSNTGMWAAIALITLGAIGVVALTLVKTRKSTEK